MTIGFALDSAIGDPYSLPHPIRAIGRLIGALDSVFMDKRVGERRDPRTERLLGALTVAIVLTVVGAVVFAISFAAYRIHALAGVAVEAVFTFYALAGKSLRVECMKVHKALTCGTLDDAKQAVSQIVGRDVAPLDSAGVTRAAVETCAENFSDGFVAPWLYAVIGGPTLAMLYKAVNTMDSTIGYHNDRYEDFGKFAARLDDAANFLPSRIAALIVVWTIELCELKFDAKNAWRIFKRDRFNHKSPNSAQTESVYAGALGVRLAGDAYYFGQLVKKPYIGDADREIEPDDIERACQLTYLACWICVIFSILAIGLLYFGNRFFSILLYEEYARSAGR